MASRFHYEGGEISRKGSRVTNIENVGTIEMICVNGTQVGLERKTVDNEGITEVNRFSVRYIYYMSGDRDQGSNSAHQKSSIDRKDQNLEQKS